MNDPKQTDFIDLDRWRRQIFTDRSGSLSAGSEQKPPGPDWHPIDFFELVRALREAHQRALREAHQRAVLAEKTAIEAVITMRMELARLREHMRRHAWGMFFLTIAVLVWALACMTR